MRHLIFLLTAAAAWGQIVADPTLETIAFPPLPSMDYTISCMMDAAGERAGSVIIAPKTGTISHVVFIVWTVATPQTLKAGIYTVDSSGNPTETAYGSMVAGTQSSPAAGTVYRVALSTGATTTAGDLIAAMVDFDATAGNLRVMYGAIALEVGVLGAWGSPRGACYTGSWSAQPTAGVLVEYSDGTLHGGSRHMFSGAGDNAYANFNSGTATTPHRGNRITPPYAMLAYDVCVMAGTWATGSSAIFRITDTARNTLASTAATLKSATSGDAQRCYPLASPVVLAAETQYYVFAIPQTTDNIAVRELTRTSGWSAYAPIVGRFARIMGDQATSFAENTGYHYSVSVRGVRIQPSGGFATAQ